MPNILGAVSRAAHSICASFAPVDEHGEAPTPPDTLAKDVKDIERDVKAGADVLQDGPALLDLLKNANGNGIDDRLFFLEKLIAFLADLPADSSLGANLESVFIDLLYNDLPHPPSAYLAPFPPIQPDAHPARYFNYRSVNGDNYAPAFPLLGRAGLPYSRSVPSASTVSPQSLPDPGLVFDLLLCRPSSKFEPHPGGLNSLFFGMANLIIHSIFDTSTKTYDINDTSSYLDLSPLYGNDVSATKVPPEALRRLDGTGRLHEDVFGDKRLLYMPPTTAALLVLLCRNHNFIAEKILHINESGTYQNPPPGSPEAAMSQDDEIYERARLVNCGFFTQIILRDYVGGILGLTRDGSPFRLDPVQPIRHIDRSFAPLAGGNQVSAEFNILYRWHAATSQPDEQFLNTLFDTLLPGQAYNTVTPRDFRTAAGQVIEANDTDPKTWEFGGLKRDPVTLRFDDAKLAELLKTATETQASAFGARNIPGAFRVIEIMTIQLGRQWRMCTLNEFRHFFGLKPYANFKEWNPDPEVYNAAESLYGTIDRLELHVGLQAEESKTPMPGAGLCPGFTISRAILGDAVALIRSDPYLTTEFTPYNCTAWGYQDCKIDSDDGSYGGALTKLLLRHLPSEYKSDDAFVHFPFLVPSFVQNAMRTRSDASVNKYDWKRPADFDFQTGTKIGNPDDNEPLETRIQKVIDKRKINRSLVNGWLFNILSNSQIQGIFADLTKRLIDQSSAVRPSSQMKQVDIVRHVINLIPVYFVANCLLGIRVKTEDNPRGLYRPDALYEMFADTANYMLLDGDITKEWHLREKAQRSATLIDKEVRGNLDRVSSGEFSLNGLFDTVIDPTSTTSISDKALAHLLTAAKEDNITHPDIAASLFVVIIPSMVQWSSIVAELLDFLLASKCSGNSINGTMKLPTDLGTHPQIGTNAEEKGETSTFLALGPSDVADIRRKASTSNPSLCVDGFMANEVFEKTASTVLRTIFNLKELNRVPGRSGRLPKFTQKILDREETHFIDNDSGLSPWPTSMILQFTS